MNMQEFGENPSGKTVADSRKGGLPWFTEIAREWYEIQGFVESMRAKVDSRRLQHKQGRDV